MTANPGYLNVVLQAPIAPSWLASFATQEAAQSSKSWVDDRSEEVVETKAERARRPRPMAGWKSTESTEISQVSAPWVTPQHAEHFLGQLLHSFHRTSGEGWGFRTPQHPGCDPIAVQIKHLHPNSSSTFRCRDDNIVSDLCLIHLSTYVYRIYPYMVYGFTRN